MNKNKKHKNKIHVKQGDVVKIIAGKDKGKIGQIEKILTKTNQVIIKNINIKTKHLRPKQEGEVGQIIKIEAAIHSSNVMLYSQEKQIASRYQMIKNSQGKKQRILIKTREIIQ